MPLVNDRPLAASMSKVKLSFRLTLLVVNAVLARELSNTMVWLPVASAAAIATASLKLTPLVTLMVAVSVVLVT
ncbi:hypothetical protein D3C85_1669260 [compost metagenome]